MKRKLYGAIEFGGTKINCLVAESVDTIIDRVQLPTLAPEETLESVANFFMPYLPLVSLGIGSFGPLNLDIESPLFGSVLETPKVGWSNINIFQFFKERLACQVHIDTDVNAAGLAEQQLGAAKGLQNIIYTTVGTGIGSGAILGGVSLKGKLHPEMGHIELSKENNDHGYVSSCSFHKSCAEGLASGGAIKKRWGVSLDRLQENHLAWDLEATYLAKYAHMLTLAYAPEKLVFGGGVITERLLEKVRDKLFPMLNGYVQTFPARKDLDDYLVVPSLGSDAGPVGCLLLALNE